MNHCLDCEKPVNRGRTHTNTDAVRCLVCKTKKLFEGWRFETPVMKLRRKEKPNDHTTDAA